jgi:hypothetical protein
MCSLQSPTVVGVIVTLPFVLGDVYHNYTSTGAVVMMIVSQVKGLLKCILFVRLFRCSGLREMYIYTLVFLYSQNCLPSLAVFLGVHNTCILRTLLLLTSVALVVTPVHVIFGCVQARGTCSPEISAIQ